MRINKWLWGLWIAMIVSMLLRRQADTYMIVALIIIPILIVLLDLHEEIAVLKEENKHQRKFVMDRYNVLSERMTDVANQIEKRLVVDFAEFAQSNQQSASGETPRLPPENRKLRHKLKKRRKPEQENRAAPQPDFSEMVEKPSDDNDKNPEKNPEV
ncbi:MAG: hypothetical protein CVV42_15275 [Candidatus Riflebacteria bacterium HGW-Riflebacteria-2]|jgi:hypothetical protein|nr:MAG: hypothetical protein CVV42_15275 [Candidatus Riflebacteria bacterium HGW-Riflebacteria-2]